MPRFLPRLEKDETSNKGGEKRGPPEGGRPEATPWTNFPVPNEWENERGLALDLFRRPSSGRKL